MINASRDSFIYSLGAYLSCPFHRLRVRRPFRRFYITPVVSARIRVARAYTHRPRRLFDVMAVFYERTPRTGGDRFSIRQCALSLVSCLVS